MLTKLLASALFAGFAAGLIAVALQFAFVQPVLLEAELYESGQAVHFGAGDAAATEAHDHNSHDHGTPRAGGLDIKRNGLTVLFSIFTYAGYGLILVAGFALAQTRGEIITARSGLIWGVAGFVAVQLAPAFGLAPELPGNAAADLSARQIWWAATVLATGTGLWLIAFGKGWLYWAISIVLLLVPHIVGAPQPLSFAGPTPPELAAEFAARALGAGLVAWAVLGLSAGFFWAREESA